MHKKLMLACMAITAFAIVPAASASPVLTSGGVKVPVGTSITGTQTGVTKFTASGLNVECSQVHVAGTVTENSGTKIKGEIPLGSAKFNGTAANAECTSALGATKVTVTTKLCLETQQHDR